MKIKARVKLELLDYTYFPSEYLKINVSFKEKGKFGTTKLSRCLIDSEDYKDSELFFDAIRESLDDKEYVKGVAIDMIESHFDKKKKNEKETNSRKSILGEISMFNMEVEVEIKE